MDVDAPNGAAACKSPGSALTFMSRSELLNMRQIWTSRFLPATDVILILCVFLQEGNQEC